jgi:hypothetical protein
MSAQNESLSSIMANTLDMIGTEGKERPNETSAASQLLNERKKQKRTIDFDDFVPLESNKKPFVVNPLLDQVASSTIDAPTYWNSGSVMKKDSKKEKRKTTNRNLKLAKKKGEDYKDRHITKVNSHVPLKKR